MYNAITRSVEQELVPALRTLGMRFLVFNPLAGGLLTGKHDFSKPPQEGRFKDNDMYLKRFWNATYFDALHGISEACAAANISMIDASIGWLKHHSALASEHKDGIIIGCSSIRHLTANLATCQEVGPLPESIVAAFEQAWKTTQPCCPKYFRP